MALLRILTTLYPQSHNPDHAQGHFLVDPELRCNGTPLPICGVCAQTVMPHCLGPLEGWMDQLRVTAESGYNMVHFTPVQVGLLAPCSRFGTPRTF